MTTNPAPPVNPLGTALPWDLVAAGYAHHLVPQFERFARVALARHPLTPGARVLDVATGPGTLALLAAAAGAQVSAIDLSPNMIAELRARATAAGARLEVGVGDGQALPFSDGSFDATFAMFGLMFFPDRAAGLRELRRVLRPGGRATIASWAPFEGPFALVLDRLHAHLAGGLPGLGSGDHTLPLSDPAAVTAELTAAGFRDIVVEPVTELLPEPSLARFWESVERATAPIMLLRHNLGEAAWRPLAAAVYADLERALGPGPVEERATALVASGVRG